MTELALISATPTAFDADGSLDLESTRGIYEHALAGGVDGLFVNGTNGEFASLSREERREVLAAAVDVAGAERVVAHVGAASPYEAGLLAADARELGVAAQSVLTPFYMPAGVAEVRTQLQAVIGDGDGAGVYLYLFPDRTGAQVEPAETAALIEEFGLAGAKLSLTGITYMEQLLEQLTTPRSILCGNDHLLREIVAAGGAGVISGVSSAVPALFVKQATAIRNGDVQAADAAGAVINTIVPVVGPSIAALKTALQQQGIIRTARCRMAISAPDEGERARITAAVASGTEHLSAA